MKTESLVLTGARLSSEVRLVCDQCEERATHRVNGRPLCLIHASEYIFLAAVGLAQALDMPVKWEPIDAEEEPAEGTSKGLTGL